MAEFVAEDRTDFKQVLAFKTALAIGVDIYYLACRRGARKTELGGCLINTIMVLGERTPKEPGDVGGVDSESSRQRRWSAVQSRRYLSLHIHST